MKMKQYTFSGLTVLLQVIMLANAFASEQAPAPELLWPAVRMFAVLAILLGVIFMAAYIFKRMNFQYNGLLGSPKNMKLLETLYLGPKKSIALLRVGQETFMLGIAANQISLLSKIDGPLAWEKGQGQKEGDFSQILGQTKEGYSKGQNIPGIPQRLKKFLGRFSLPEAASPVSRERVS